MKPRFRENDFAGGLDAAADQLIARINGEALPAVDARAANSATARRQRLRLAGPRRSSCSSACWSARRSRARVFGKMLGPLALGGGAGAVAWLVTPASWSAVLAAVAALS